MIHDIVLYPDRRLQTPCRQVEEFDTPELHQLIADMFETMYFHGGVGLAAPQIGVMKQAAVIDVTAGEDSGKRIVIINPKVTATEGMQRDYEGCLCLPGFREEVTRALRVAVDAREATGGPVRLRGDGLLSRALQHETDHLNGVLFIQRLSTLKCDLIRRRIRKMLKAGEWGAAISAPRSPPPTRWKVGGP